ncbi:MAG: transporter substrate-binding domain-containing protein [Lachnospiraceae bacterium]
MKNNKILVLMIVVMMVIGTLVGCGSTATVTSEVINEEQSEGTSLENGTTDTGKEVLKVGMECAYPPFNWTQNNLELADGSTAVQIYGSNFYAYGYDVAVAQMIADELGMELEIHKVEWDSIAMSLDAGQYDCIIAGMGRTAKREASYSFTDAYYYRNNCLVVKKGSAFENFTGISEFAGMNVTLTTQLGTGWVDLLEQIPDGKLGANYATTSECFMAIQNDVADVCVIDVPTALAAQQTNSDLVIIELEEGDAFVGDEEMTNICIATRKDDTELTEKLQGALDAIGWNDKEEMDQLMEKMITLMPSNN